MSASLGSELEKPDGDGDVGPQPRYHFSRQPAKYIRAPAKPKAVIPRSPSLPLRTPTLANAAAEPGTEGDRPEGGSTPQEVPEESDGSRSSSTDASAPKQRSGGRQQLRHFEITQETARIVSRFKGDDASAAAGTPPESAGAADDLNAGTYL